MRRIAVICISNFLLVMEITKTYVQVFKPHGNNMYFEKCQKQKIQLNSNALGLSKRKTNLHKWLYKIIILPFFTRKVKIFFPSSRNPKETF